MVRWCDPSVALAKGSGVRLYSLQLRHRIPESSDTKTSTYCSLIDFLLIT